MDLVLHDGCYIVALMSCSNIKQTSLAFRDKSEAKSKNVYSWQ